MLHLERHTSPMEGGSSQGSQQASGAIGVGRFRVAVGAVCSNAQITPRSLDEVAAEFFDAEQRSAMDVARQEAHREAAAHAVAALNEATIRLDEAREKAQEALSADAVALGVEIARQILKVQIHQGDYALEAIVRSTLAASEIRRGRCIVHLNPDDASSLEDIVFRGETEIVADGDVARGCVELETPRGLLVRDPNAALEEIREQLLEDLV